MKNIFFVTFFILALLGGFAQNEHKVDSLKKVLPALHDSARVDCLNELSEAYLRSRGWYEKGPRNTSIDSVEIWISAALEESHKIGYTYGIAKALSLKSDIVFTKYDDYPQTENLSRESIRNYKKSASKKGLYRPYWRLGVALYALSKYDDAINNLDTSYKLSKVAGDSLYVLAGAGHGRRDRRRRSGLPGRHAKPRATAPARPFGKPRCPDRPAEPECLRP